MSGTREIRLLEPEVAGHSATFSWEVIPSSRLYHRTSFTLDFPESVDLGAVPRALWWRIALICLHSHWALLRPRRVMLPITLGPGEAEAWQRLSASEAVALASRAGREREAGRSVELVEAGPAVPLTPVAGNGPPVLCFSGGRDSLVHAGLLRELGDPPLLVTTTSPREGSVEHETERRAFVLADAARRLEMEHVEVRSDFRSAWDNGWSGPSHGISVNEVTDCFLFLAVAVVTAVASGASRVLMASEFEIQNAWRVPGGIAQFHHFMYSGVTQRCLRGLLEPSGIGILGLTSPLQQFQVERLLVQRYPDLLDLQYSCWELERDQGACSRCAECRGNGLNVLADGVDPAVIQIDLAELLIANAGWDAKPVPSLSDEQMVRAGHRIEPAMVRRLLEPREPAVRDAALRGFEALRARTSTRDVPPEPGYRAGYLEWVDEPLREPLRAILAAHFAEEPAERYAEQLHLARLLGRWVQAPLGHARDRPERDPPRGPTARPPAPRPLTGAELEPISHLIPGPEPTLVTPPGRDPIRVASTSLDGNERRYVEECLATNWVSSTGPFVARFEAAVAEAVGCAHAVACSSGAAALQLAYAAAGIGPGDEVIMPAFTMVATANAAAHLGARAVLVDTDPGTWTIDIGAVAAAIGPRTRAICAVHTYGQPVDMDALGEIASANSLVLVEDAAEAHGAKLRGRRAGSLGDVAAFSFYGNKILTTGEGGMVTTDDHVIAATARELRDHGFSPERHFWHRLRAYNMRMSNLQAAIGLAQTERLGALLAERRRVAEGYRMRLTDVPGLTLPPVVPDTRSAHWMFGLLVGSEFGMSRDDLRRHLATAGIETRTFFVPLHIQPAYLREHQGRRLPVAEQLGTSGLYLPSGPSLTDSDLDVVADAIAGAARSTPSAVGARPSPE